MLHRVLDRSSLPLELAFTCHTCGSKFDVVGPTPPDYAAARAWLERHPSSLKMPSLPGSSS